jgi:putative endonuclease
MDKKMFVYIITNYANTVFYTGVTNNLQRRIYEHKTGTVDNSFSKKYKLYKLIWFEEFNSSKEAIIIEKRVKDMRREKKLKLITDKNPKFNDLIALR